MPERDANGRLIIKKKILYTCIKYHDHFISILHMTLLSNCKLEIKPDKEVTVLPLTLINLILNENRTFSRFQKRKFSYQLNFTK